MSYNRQIARGCLIYAQIVFNGIRIYTLQPNDREILQCIKPGSERFERTSKQTSN